MDRNESRIIKFVAKVLGGIALVVIFAFFFGYFIMLLWNWLMPTIFGLPLIGYWQAWGLLILAKLLFGSGNYRGGRNHNSKNHKKMKIKFKKWLRDEMDDKPDEKTVNPSP